MSIPAFDYDGYWRDGDGVRDSSLWRERGLHWHCHLWRGNASECEDESARRDPSTDLPPKELGDWLRKPARTIRLVGRTPEEVMEWLRGEWTAVRDQLGQESAAIDEEARFGRALYDLRLGQAVCWSGWLSGATFWHAAAVPTESNCH
ncbi:MULTISPECIES: hypothetical protein [Thermomonospora]|uniref:Uncharacterized protein n=1 Tax=Thermomonospora curvata (strain ATCC 19995 / DSM 43183 / JCM 3096 / KCTC 9072 / NBRC 15933 / NCIMB 10081 / Henssen B9) TaxID=471852 RepID=D1A5B0_THECD|nr:MULTISPECIES: hypothetical protein [Thermomonospora]ACZ00096.1 hypothetical protein Tcur_4572 [Thermomonospora curvata DSM 43183]PKK11927.1 MAG: hypothetical protein BUE48_022465 [Thermomonospora sp. CIF 1]